ncbi:MAG: hypothetical protein IPP67_02970 [Rhodospirillaceae bacterium]|nr:hypothetical protein [Rhodospirillaceae bacterium]
MHDIALLVGKRGSQYDGVIANKYFSTNTASSPKATFASLLAEAKAAIKLSD